MRPISFAVMLSSSTTQLTVAVTTMADCFCSLQLAITTTNLTVCCVRIYYYFIPYWHLRRQCWHQLVPEQLVCCCPTSETHCKHMSSIHDMLAPLWNTANYLMVFNNPATGYCTNSGTYTLSPAHSIVPRISEGDRNVVVAADLLEMLKKSVPVSASQNQIIAQF